MTGAKKINLVSVEDYLAGELNSPVKHEYIGGQVYAMVGARNAHNIIAGNAFASLWSQLRGSSCRPYNSDTKIRLRMPSSEYRFYYPDLSVVCHPNAQSDVFQDAPVVVIEVLSAKTRRIDEGEKKDAYFTIRSLMVYLLVEQDAPFVVVWRRSEHGFSRVEYKGIDVVIPLDEIKATLLLSDLYDGVEFIPELND